MSESKINVLFNAPYNSILMLLNYVSRLLKKIYNNLFNSLDEINIFSKNYLDGSEINHTLLENYKETLNKYIAYSERNKNLNLNNFKLEE